MFFNDILTEVLDKYKYNKTVKQILLKNQKYFGIYKYNDYYIDILNSLVLHEIIAILKLYLEDKSVFNNSDGKNFINWVCSSFIEILKTIKDENLAIFFEDLFDTSDFYVNYSENTSKFTSIDVLNSVLSHANFVLNFIKDEKAFKRIQANIKSLEEKLCYDPEKNLESVEENDEYSE